MGAEHRNMRNSITTYMRAYHISPISVYQTTIHVSQCKLRCSPPTTYTKNIQYKKVSNVKHNLTHVSVKLLTPSCVRLDARTDSTGITSNAKVPPVTQATAVFIINDIHILFDLWNRNHSLGFPPSAASTALTPLDAFRIWRAEDRYGHSYSPSF